MGSLNNVAEPEFLLEARYPGFAFDVPVSAQTLGANSYNTEAYEASDNTILDGTVTVSLNP